MQDIRIVSTALGQIQGREGSWRPVARNGVILKCPLDLGFRCSFRFLGSFGRVRRRGRRRGRRRLRRHMGRHLRYLTITVARAAMLMRWIMLHLVGTRREVRLLWVARPNGRN